MQNNMSNERKKKHLKKTNLILTAARYSMAEWVSTVKAPSAYQRGLSDQKSCFHTKPFNLHLSEQVKRR